MPIYTNDPCDDGFFPVEPSLRSSIGIGPKITKAIDVATRDWLDEHPEATTTVEDDSLTNAKFMDGSVNSRVIEDESITTNDIADLAVTTPKISDLAVTASKIADDAITADKIADSAADGLRTMSTIQPGVAKVGAGLAMNNGALELNGGDIAPAVTAWLNAHPEATTTVQDGAITTPKLADGTVTDAKLAQTGIKSMLLNQSEYYQNGTFRLLTENWIVGNLNATGEIDQSINTRVSTLPYLQFDYDIEIPTVANILFIVCIYNSDKTLISRTIYNNYNRITISKNTIFRICVYDNSDTPVVNINDMSKNVVVADNAISESYAIASSFMNGYDIGRQYLKSAYATGNLYSDGLIDFTSVSRVTYYQYMKYPTDVRLHFDSGYNGIICIYDDSLVLQSRTVLYADYTVPEGNIFRLTVFDASSSSTVTNIEAIAHHVYIRQNRNAQYHDLISVFESFVVIGDSLSCGYVNSGAGSAYSSNQAREAHRNWPSYLGLSIDRPFINLARGSSSAHDWRYGNIELDVNIQTADIDTYCYMVGIGVNDVRQGLSVGATTSINIANKDENADTFYGNYDWLVRKLIEYKEDRLSQAKIFVFTIPPTEVNAETYNAAIRYVASLYSDVYCIDLYNLFYTEFTSEPFMALWIGGHSRPIGYAMLAEFIRQGINEYMQDNVSEFSYVPWASLT